MEPLKTASVDVCAFVETDGRDSDSCDHCSCARTHIGTHAWRSPFLRIKETEITQT